MTLDNPPETADNHAPGAIPAYLQRTYDDGKKVLGLDFRIWSVGIVVIMIVAIELLTRLGIVSKVNLVPVTVMTSRAFTLLTTKEFYINDIFPTAEAILLSFVIATIIGVTIGMAIAESKTLEDILGPYITAYYAIPTFALYPLFVVVMGQGLLSITVLGVLFSTVAIIMQSRDGFRTLPSSLRKYAQAERIPKGTFFFRILLPNAFPYILSGMRLGFIYAVVGVIACEFILATKGLGHFVSYSYETFATTDMYAGMLIILTLSWLSIVGMSKLLNRFSWRELS